MLAVLWYRLPAVAYAAALYWASSRSRLPMPKWGLGFEDKLIHFVAFGLLAWLVHRALSLPRPLLAHVTWATAFLCTVYALSDEWHQSFVPGRYFDLWDLVFDMAGIGTVLALHYFRRRTPKLA